MTADHNRQNCDIGGCDICMSYIDLMLLIVDENRAKRQAEAADEFERLRAVCDRRSALIGELIALCEHHGITLAPRFHADAIEGDNR